MKINFKKDKKELKGDFLFISVNNKNNDEVIKEGDQKTLYLKREEDKMNLRKFFLFLRKIVALSKGAKAKRIVLNFNDLIFSSLKLKQEEVGEIVGFEIPFANYEFLKYKTVSKEENSLIEEVVILGVSPFTEKDILNGALMAEEVNKARDLSNTPGGDMTPSILAMKAKEAVKKLPVKVQVFGETEMEKLKMNAILSVGRGSDEESKFIKMEYMGGKKNDRPIVLVGKGVTFDTGGINLKPSNSLLGMNMDMSGGAAVIHTIALAAKMKLKKNVIGLIPSVENMASGKSYRPGDVIRSMSGQTIEVLNTDAEGRVILADALTYSQKYNPEVVIDVATLTGAAMVALGERMSAIFTDDDDLCKKLENVGDKAGD
jgi:leucyl aminopeptidase